MKKNKIILPLLSLALMGCSQKLSTTLPTAEKTRENTPSLTATATALPRAYQVKKTTAGLYEMLSHLGEKGNYRADYAIDEETYHDVFNETYYYSSLTDSGAVLLEYYHSPEEKVLYSFDASGNTLSLGSLLKSEEGKLYSSPAILNPMVLISEAKYKVTAGAFKSKADGTLYSDDVIVILAFAMLTGHSQEGLNEVYSEVDFSFPTEDSTSFGFDLRGKSTSGDQSIVSYQTGTISEIDVAKEEKWDAALRGLRLPEKALSQEESSLFTGTSLKTTSKITLHSGDEEPEEVAEVEVNYNADKLEIFSSDLKTKTESRLNYERSGKTTLEKGLNGRNEVTSLDMEVSFDELSFFSTFFTADAFLSDDEESYRYFGEDGDALLYSLTFLPSLGAVHSMSLEKKGDSFVLKTTTERTLDQDEYLYNYYTIETQFTLEPSFTPVSAYAPDRDTAKIKNAFDLLKAGKRFKAVSSNQTGHTSDSMTLTVADNIAYYEVKSSQYGNLTYGYYQKDEDTLIAFNVKDGNVSKETSQPEKGKTLDDYIKNRLSPEAFRFDEKGRIVPKNMVIDLKEDFLPGIYPSYMIPQTFMMFTDTAGKINRATYQYSFSYQGQTYQGRDAIDFSQYGTAKIEPTLLTKIEALA